jgi:AraC-like DNA-binding protein/ligand-binding sensor protein
VKTNPILLRAQELMKEYERATGAQICILDHNYLPLPELSEDMLSEKNACLFCIKYKKHIKTKSFQDLYDNPCREMHINAVMEAQRSGGSYIYVCPLGFIFWASVIYLNGRFIGAILGSGFLGIDSEDACARMRSVCEEALSEAELKLLLSRFPQKETQKIKALSELMLICAKSVSVGNEDFHEATKRRLEQQSDLSAKIEELKNQYPQSSPRPEYPMDKERKLLEALRQGDTESGKNILNEILAILFYANPDQFKHIQYRAIELAVLLSRLDTGSGFTAKNALEANMRYIKSIQETGNIEELTDALYRIVDDLTEQILYFRGIQHPSALKKAEIYILENLSRKISLDEIAKAAGFSAPYFSTLFKEEMGENLSSYLNRFRVEKAKTLLMETDHSLSKIARSCGFEDQSWFSKIFKLFTGISPGKYRSQGGKPVVSKFDSPAISV